VAEAMGVNLPKETTAAESPNWVSNLEPCDNQTDALAVCYCLIVMDNHMRFHYPCG